VDTLQRGIPSRLWTTVSLKVKSKRDLWFLKVVAPCSFQR
jgi:hypothetical protein